jgi:hypothetical protein
VRAPVSRLRELVHIPSSEGGRDIAERLVRAGLEVETVEVIGEGVVGTLVMALVANSTVGYTVAQALALAFSDAWESVATTWSYATHVAPSTVLLPLLLVSTVAVISLWWLTISVLSKRQQVVYHIPVRFE